MSLTVSPRLKYSSSTSLAVLNRKPVLYTTVQVYCRPHLTRSRLAPVILMHSSPTFTVYLYSSIAAPCDWLKRVNIGL